MTDMAVVELSAQAITAERFAPYGTLIAAPDNADDPSRTPDATLELSRGVPRFYVMSLADKTPRFDHITRHRRVTQCLASAGGQPWLLGVAPPSDDESDAGVPDARRLAAFAIPGDVAVALHRGTWHAGPFFSAPTAQFFNLELADTNVVDHHTAPLDRTYVIDQPDGQ